MSNDMEIKVKARTEGGEEVRTLGGDMKGLAGEVQNLSKTSDDISAYQKQKKELVELSIKLRDSQVAARENAEEYGKGSSAYARAEGAVESLRKKIEQQRASLNDLGVSLRKSGVDTNNLADEQSRLQREVNATQEAFVAAKRVQDAYATLGIKSTADNNAEIRKLKDSYNLLKAAGGVAHEDLQRAAAALKARLGEVNAEQTKSKAGFDLTGMAALKAAAGFTALGYAAASAMKGTFDVMSKVEKSGFALESSVKAANREFSNTGSLDGWKNSIGKISENLRIYSGSAVTEAAAKTIDMTKRLGLSAEQMEIVIKRSGDMGAGKMELADSVERVTAALRGEAESAEALGLTLNEDYVKGWYAANGAHEKAWKDLTDLEKAQIRYQVMLEQTNASQGKAAESTKTFSGAMSAMKASVEDNIAKNPQLLASMTDLGNIIRENSEIIAVFASGVATVTGFLIDSFADMNRGVQIVFGAFDIMLSNASLGLLNFRLIWEKVFGSDENVKAVEALIDAEKRHQDAIVKTINDIANEGEKTGKVLVSTGQKAEETGQKTRKALSDTKTAAIDLEQAFENLDRSGFFRGNVRVEQFSKLAEAIRQEPVKALDELGSRLDKLSAEELQAFQKSFQASSGTIMGFADESKAALEAVADVLLKKFGVDSKEVLTGIDSQFTELAKNFDTLGKNAEVTGNELFAAFRKMSESANSTQEYEKLDGILKQLGNSGKVSGEQVDYAFREMGVQAVKQLIEEIGKADDSFEFDKIKTDMENLYQSGIINSKQYGAALDQLKAKTEGTATAIDEIKSATQDAADETEDHTKQVEKSTEAAKDETDALKKKAKALEDEAKLLEDSAKLHEQKAKAAQAQYKADSAALEQAKKKLEVAESTGTATAKEISALERQIEQLEKAAAASKKLAGEQKDLAEDTEKAADALVEQAGKLKSAADGMENLEVRTYSVVDAGVSLANNLRDVSEEIYRAVYGLEELDSGLNVTGTNAHRFASSFTDLDFSSIDQLVTKISETDDLLLRTSDTHTRTALWNIRAMLAEAETVSGLNSEYKKMFSNLESGGYYSASAMNDLNTEAEKAVSGIRFLDEERLENLKDSINEAKAAMNDLREAALEAEQALKEMTADYQDEIDELSGNKAAIENRRYEKELAKLKELYAAAGELGREEYEQNLKLAEQIHQKKLAQINERAAAERVASGTDTSGSGVVAERVPYSIVRQIEETEAAAKASSSKVSSRAATRTVELKISINNGGTVTGLFDESSAESFVTQLKRAKMVS